MQAFVSCCFAFPGRASGQTQIVITANRLIERCTHRRRASLHPVQQTFHPRVPNPIQRGGKDRRGVPRFTQRIRVSLTDPPFSHVALYRRVSLTSLDRFPLRLLPSCKSRFHTLIGFYCLIRCILPHRIFPYTSLFPASSYPSFYLIASTYSFMLQLLATSYLGSSCLSYRIRDAAARSHATKTHPDVILSTVTKPSSTHSMRKRGSCMVTDRG